MAAAPSAGSAAAVVGPNLSEPNQYHLSGGGIAVSYYPQGIGPVPAGSGPVCLIYQDAHLVKSFGRDELRTVASPDLGTIVSVTLQRSIDAGSTSFSVLVPAVRLPESMEAATPVKTIGITTVHRSFLVLPGYGQQEISTAVALSGDARVGILPLLASEPA
jgi:hypothetical protein